MLIKYIGHACFKLRDGETGYSIVFDPYKAGCVKGFGTIKDAASEVLCSHDHGDHNGTECITIEPMEESPYEVKVIDTYHDAEKGARRGTNRIFVVTHKKSGEKLIHYGDIGEKLDDLLTEENLELLSGADVALVPVGGVYTYDKSEALDLIERTRPKLVLPMHYRADAAGFGLPEIGSIEDFLIEAAGRGHGISVGQMWFVETEDYNVDADILVLRPQNMQP